MTIARSLFRRIFGRQPQVDIGAQVDVAALQPQVDIGAQADAAALRRARVTVITDIPFWESSYGSHARLQSLFAALADEVDLTVYVFKSIGRSVEKEIRALNATYKVISYKTYEKRNGASFHRGALANDPAFRGKAHESWLRAARDYLEEVQPDAVIVEYIDRSWVLEAVPPGTAKILDAHDVMSSRIGVFARFGQETSIKLSARDETRLMQLYDAILAISRFDAADITRRLGVRRVLTVPHAIPARPLYTHREQAQTLLFMGAGSAPNVEGLNWFLDQVWPVISDRFTLKVVGTVCGKIGRRPKNVELLGRVADLDSVLADTDIAVNPVFIGGGLKIKTIDALAAGLPSVNCAEAVRGIDHLAPRALAVADSRASFVAEILRLAKDAPRRQAMSESALAAVETEFAPAQVFRDLTAFLDHVRRPT